MIDEFRNRTVNPTPTGDMKYITGNVVHDALFHVLETEYGLVAEYGTRWNWIRGYHVVDEDKFLLFLLRWT